MITERQYNRNYQKRLIKYSSYWSSVFANIISDQYKAVADNIQGNLNDLITSTPYLKAFYKLYLTVGMQEAQLRYNEFQKQKKDKEQILYDWGNFLRNHVALHTGNKVTRITANTRDIIKEFIQQGLENGDGYDKIAKDLRKAAGDDALKGRINVKARALTIARTEGASAANLGALQAAKASGLLMEKTWLHGYNAKRQNRLAHILLGKEKGIPLDHDFLVNGKMMAYPGDPRGGPEEVINCKCTLIMRPVKSGAQPVELTQDRPESVGSRLLRLAVTTSILTDVFDELFGENYKAQ
jgi:hypothetical protein